MNKLTSDEFTKDKKDVFCSYLLKNESFDSIYDIPYMDNTSKKLPKLLVPYNDINQYDLNKDTFTHFYIDDYKFDGTYSIWNAIVHNCSFKKGFNFGKFNNLGGVICPDYSLTGDMPRALQIWNVYRSRVIGIALLKKGINAIPNIRWTDKYSYSYAFAGIKQGSIVAVGTYGCSKSREDKAMLISGFEEMIKRIKPFCIIIYGSIIPELNEVLVKYNQYFIQFDSQRKKDYEVIFNGNEI